VDCDCKEITSNYIANTAQDGPEKKTRVIIFNELTFATRKIGRKKENKLVDTGA